MFFSLATSLLLTTGQPLGVLFNITPTPNVFVTGAQAFTMAQASISPEIALERLFTEPVLETDWFTPIFLSQVPVAPEQIIRDLQASLGEFQSLQPEGDGYRVVFERGTLLALIRLNADGQIAGLLFQDVRTGAIDLPGAIAQLQALPGQTNLLVLEITPTGTTDLANLNADQPLAVGSAFKLAVLVALQREIEAGRRHWQDVVALQPQDRSLPSGFLQTWFEGALLTLQSLATLMISQSDNTATDLLIRTLGREPIEAVAPRNRPFLTTREAFVLKGSQNTELLQRYREGSTAQRRELLPALAAAPLPPVVEFTDQPLALDVEWFFSPRELCTLMAQVSELPLMGVNPGGGLVDLNAWSQVAFKGGSEPGVLNFTTALTAPSGQRYCISATWNNPEAALDTDRFVTLYSGLIAGLATPTP